MERAPLGPGLRRPLLLWPPPWLLLLVLQVSPTPPTPPVARISRPFAEVDQMVERFSHKMAANYSVFLVDPASQALYVGAKDTIFALPLDGISHGSRMVPWNVLQTPRNSCTTKGKKEAECHNFIRILEFANRTHLFVCGTFAFDPQCGFIKVSDFRRVESPESGRGKCPFEPLQPSAAVMADGILYAATVNNFLSTEPIISRATGSPAELIRTDTSVAWLNDPEFVASAFIRETRTGDDDKIYFFFTETAREYDFYEKVKVARVARVCKGDLGGQKTLQKKWTTFLKTRLVCTDPETGTVFNILKDVATLPSTNGTGAIFYGVFVAQRNEGTGSAVCAYSLESIRRAMDGRFKEFKRDCDKRGQDEVPNPRPGACITNSMKLAGFGSSLALPDRVLTFIRDHPLMDQPAYPLENRPMLVKPGTQYRRLAVHRVRALSGQEHEVLYLGTEDGHLHKAVKAGPDTSLLEDWTLFTEHQPIRNLLIHQDLSSMAQRRLVEALQLSRELVIVECCQDPAKWVEEESCSPTSLTAPHRVPLRKDSHGIYSLCFAPDGRQLAAGFGNGSVQLVDTATGLPGPSLSLGHHVRHATTAVSFHRLKPGLLLAAGADGTLSVYSLPSPNPVASWTEKENEINALDVCRDGSAFATAGKDRHIRLYDSHTNQLFHVMEAPDFMAGDEFTPHSGHSRRIFALRFHPTELHLFLTGGWDNSVKVWDKRVSKGAQGMLNGPHICGPGIDAKGSQVLTGSWVPRNALQLWDLRTTQLWENLPFPGSPTQGEFLYSARFCTGNVVIAGGSGTCGASLLRVGTGQVVGEIRLPNKPVHVVTSAPGGPLVAAAGAGGNLHLAELS